MSISEFESGRATTHLLASIAQAISQNDDIADRRAPLDADATPLEFGQYFSRRILTADVGAVHAVETAIAGRTENERIQVIALLGQLSAKAGQAMDASLASLIRQATKEHRLSAALVHRTCDKLRNRHSNEQFITWVAGDPDGFTRFAWSSTMRAAGERIWDRNWARVTDQLTPSDWVNIPTEPENTQRVGWYPFDESTRYARSAAVGSLIASSLSQEQDRRQNAWYVALEAAGRSSGALTWARHADAIRTTLGQPAWSQVNTDIAQNVAALIADLPDVVGIIGTLALAAEAANATARASTVVTCAQKMAGNLNLEDALAAASSLTPQALPLSA